MKGDFLGFSFGGVHSDSLGIVRTSGGDRFTEQLHPEIKDITAEVPGMDGEYYFGSTYGTKEIDLEFAFDSLTERQFRELRQVFGTKEIKKLVFDERPYKYYMVKIKDPIELSYVCFDEPKRIEDTQRNGVRRDRDSDKEYEPGGHIEEEFEAAANETTTFSLSHIPVSASEIEFSVEGCEYDSENNTCSFLNETDESISITVSYDYAAIPAVFAWEQVTPWKYIEGTERIYKGEGKISFVSYFPFAKSSFRVLPEADEESYEGRQDWAISSGILTENIRNLYYIDRYGSTSALTVEPANEGFNIINAETFKNKVGHIGIFIFNYLGGIGGSWYCNISSSPINLADYGAEYVGESPEPGTTFTVTYSNLGKINVYNAGETATGFCLYLKADTLGNGIILSYRPTANDDMTPKFQLRPITTKPYQYSIKNNNNISNPQQEGLYELINNKYKLSTDTIPVLSKIYYEGITDIGILIDTNTGLINGISSIAFSSMDDNPTYTTSGNIYNEYIDAGYFFKLQPNITPNEINTPPLDMAQLELNDLDGQSIVSNDDGIRIFYDYLYF